MESIKQHSNQFINRGSQYFQELQKKAFQDVVKYNERLNKMIHASNTSIAMSDWDTIVDTPISNVAPRHFKYGSLKLIDGSKSIKIPLLLPTNVDAVMLNFNDDSRKGTNVLQNILLRLLLSTRIDLAKVSIVDMNFGTCFPIATSINNPKFMREVIYRQEDVTRLIADLAKEISEANVNFLGRYPDIDTYNAQASEMAQPYHFVFIDNFPNGFSSQSVEGLLRLINNGVASRAGIKIFINYNAQKIAIRDFDLTPFKELCSWIDVDKQGNVVFTNWFRPLSPNLIPSIDIELPQNVSDYIDFLNNMKSRQISYSLKRWREDLKNKNLIWSGNTCDGINVPIGYISPSKTFDFYIANDNDSECNDFFALIAGRPGYGKTVFLHNIIVNAAMKYSPDELNFYFADFAEGASFSIYRNLPHAKALMLSNNKEYALRILRHLSKEGIRRANLYKKALREKGKQVTNIASYRELTGEKLPRIVFVMDEFHYLFLSTDPITIAAKEELCNGIRQWRKFGISIILCTQTISGVNFGDADKQITYRFALNLLDMDSKTVIRNDAAKTLQRKGQAILNNTADGNSSMNVEFQSAYDGDDYHQSVEYLAQLFKQKQGVAPKPFICESGNDADMSDNSKLHEEISIGAFEKNHQSCDVYVGQPDLLRKSHTRIRYLRRNNSNTLIVGDDYRTLIYNIASQIMQLQVHSHPSSKFYIVDAFNVGDDYKGALNEIQDVSENISVGNQQSVVSFIDELYAELERRKAEQKESEMTEGRMVLAIMNAQNCYELKPTQAKFGMEPSASSKKLSAILSDGGPLGMHCIIHCHSYETMFKSNGVLSNKEFAMFENIILLKGADVANMFIGGIKVASPMENGLVVVMNNKVDNEQYEQCKAYSEITATEKTNQFVVFLYNLFEQYRYAQ